jgi:hypothetical protein
MHLKFKVPKLDTCTKCDTLNTQIKYSLNDLEKHELIKTLQTHQELADFAYLSKAEDKENCKMDSTHKIYTFDLQQCLSTPCLNTSMSFYKRQLWTFNLTIHDCVTGQPYCFMWHENVAGRGANQVASCLYKFINEFIVDPVKKITFYSDTCGGQNKNNIICGMFQIAAKNHPSVEIIDQKFLIPGHTHMECDIDHAIIEKMKRNSGMLITVPQDWYQLVRQAGKKKN